MRRGGCEHGPRLREALRGAGSGAGGRDHGQPALPLGAQQGCCRAKIGFQAFGSTTVSTAISAFRFGPNDANFVYETPTGAIAYDQFELLSGSVRRIPGGDSSWPRDPVRQLCRRGATIAATAMSSARRRRSLRGKARFFGSLETSESTPGEWILYRVCGGGRACPAPTPARARAPVGGEACLALAPSPSTAPSPKNPTSHPSPRPADRARFRDRRCRHRNSSERQPGPELEIEARRRAARCIDMLPYLKLKLLAESVGDRATFTSPTSRDFRRSSVKRTV